MKPFLITLIIIILASIGGYIYITKGGDEEATNEKCCTTCPSGKVKYYSIVNENNNCGECCLSPKLYWIFKIFEPNMVLAETNTCESLGYTTYVQTETHGAYPLKVTIDRYKK